MYQLDILSSILEASSNEGIKKINEGIGELVETGGLRKSNRVTAIMEMLGNTSDPEIQSYFRSRSMDEYLENLDMFPIMEELANTEVGQKVSMLSQQINALIGLYESSGARHHIQTTMDILNGYTIYEDVSRAVEKIVENVDRHISYLYLKDAIEELVADNYTLNKSIIEKLYVGYSLPASQVRYYVENTVSRYKTTHAPIKKLLEKLYRLVGHDQAQTFTRSFGSTNMNVKYAPVWNITENRTVFMVHNRLYECHGKKIRAVQRSENMDSRFMSLCEAYSKVKQTGQSYTIVQEGHQIEIKNGNIYLDGTTSNKVVEQIGMITGNTDIAKAAVIISENQDCILPIGYEVSVDGYKPIFCLLESDGSRHVIMFNPSDGSNEIIATDIKESYASWMLNNWQIDITPLMEEENTEEEKIKAEIEDIDAEIEYLEGEKEEFKQELEGDEADDDEADDVLETLNTRIRHRIVQRNMMAASLIANNNVSTITAMDLMESWRIASGNTGINVNGTPVRTSAPLIISENVSIVPCAVPVQDGKMAYGFRYTGNLTGSGIITEAARSGIQLRYKSDTDVFMLPARAIKENKQIDVVQAVIDLLESTGMSDSDIAARFVELQASYNDAEAFDIVTQETGNSMESVTTTLDKYDIKYDIDESKFKDKIKKGITKAKEFDDKLDSILSSLNTKIGIPERMGGGQATIKGVSRQTGMVVLEQDGNIIKAHISSL